MIRLAFILALAMPCLAADERYTFGAKFEPREGFLIHGMGQWGDENREYLAMLGDVGIHPLTRLFFLDIEPTRPWEKMIVILQEYLAEEKAAKLPATLTVSLIVFIMPTLFVVLLGPAILRAIDGLGGL